MKLIMLPLLFSVACIAYQNRDRIADQYNAAYPSDPAKQAALAHCIADTPGFNRLDADDRMYCYRKGLGAGEIAATPTASPYYAYSPSHLAGNDVRRQQANAGYRLPRLIAAAAAASAREAATAYQPSRPRVFAQVTAHHPAAARHVAAVAWRTR